MYIYIYIYIYIYKIGIYSPKTYTKYKIQNLYILLPQSLPQWSAHIDNAI